MDCTPVSTDNNTSSNLTGHVFITSGNGDAGSPLYIVHSAYNQSHVTNVSLLPQRLMGNDSSDLQPHYTGSANGVSLEHIEDFLYSRVIVIICIFGVIGNILNLIVLTRKGLQKTMDRMEKSAHYGLVALAISDMIFCLVILPHAWVDKFGFVFSSKGFALYYTVYEGGIINAFIMSSTWLTCAMATSRYLAICHPLRAREIIGMTFAKASILVVFILCLVFNLPRFFLSKIEPMDCVGNWRVYFIHKGALKESPTAEAAYLWCYFVLAILIPLIVLAYCNVNLIRALKESYKMRAQYKNCKSSRESTNHITLTLIVIVIMYFLLVLPAEIINFLKMSDLVDVSTLGHMNLAVAIVNTLQAINFSLNFVLYCVINVHFRRTIMEIFCCCFVKKSKDMKYTSVTSGVSFQESTTRNTAYTEC